MNNRRSYHNTDRAGRSEWGEWVMEWCEVKNIGLAGLSIATKVAMAILSAMLQQYAGHRPGSIRSKWVPKKLFAIIKALRDEGDGRGGLKTRQEAYEGIVLFKKNPNAKLTAEGEKWVRDQIDANFPDGSSESKESKLIRAFTAMLAGEQIPLQMLMQLFDVLIQAYNQFYKNPEAG